MPSFVKFNQFEYDLAEKVHNLNSDTINVALSNTTPSAGSNKVWADITEIAAGNGYSAGGASISASGGTASGTFTLTGTNVTWTASGGSIGPFRYIILYNTSTSPNTKPLIGYWDYGSAVTLNNGNTFTVQFNSGVSFGTTLTVS